MTLSHFLLVSSGVSFVFVLGFGGEEEGIIRRAGAWGYVLP